MSPAPQTTAADAEFEREKAEQEEIAAQIESDAPVKSTPQVAGTEAPEETTVDEVIEEQPEVTLRTVPGTVEQYPLTVGVVGAPDGELVFEDEDATIDVSPQVAEQVTYLPNVEVIA